MLMEQLAQNITNLVRQAGGVWGIAVEDLQSGERFGLNEHGGFMAASLIKLPIMAAVYAAAYEGRLRLDDQVSLRAGDKAGGSGILQHMAPGMVMSIKDLITLMIIQSDNTATNMLIDLIGPEPIRRTMLDLGMQQSVFANKTGLFLTDPPGQNITTAADVSLLLRKLASGSFISRHACADMIAVMKLQQLGNGLAERLPAPSASTVGRIPEWQWAGKTGSLTGIAHEAGVLYVGHRSIIVSVLSESTANPGDVRKMISSIGEQVFLFACGTH
ncbi:serine hydrolase [Paenibacillus thalictri]|uniref:Serine hydrolase n=1 Tax=Paenibacillus thalictri TaxID=2527873 RepID=A0A4Q9DPW2_9BACL|nr:serine hydrolase [Paenibacillus thalictri]TBL76006.1 serine hydrolase [Paenibacillus thalictri]